MCIHTKKERFTSKFKTTQLHTQKIPKTRTHSHTHTHTEREREEKQLLVKLKTTHTTINMSNIKAD